MDVFVLLIENAFSAYDFVKIGLSGVDRFCLENLNFQLRLLYHVLRTTKHQEITSDRR
jgi:hypothetical protein